MKQGFAIIAVAVLTVLVASAYCNTFYSPLILDDFHSFVQEEKIYITDWSISSLAILSKTVFGWTRWIPLFLFSVDHWLGKGNIVFYHLTNLLIHVLSLFAIIFLVYNILIASEDRETYREMPYSLFAVFVGGLWVLHPVQTNAVTYLVQRMASIQALFYILSVAFYTLARRKHIQSGRFKTGSLYYLTSVITAFVAFFSKENSAMLPVMLLVTEIWFFSPGLLAAFRKSIKRMPAGVWLLLGIVLVLVSFYAARTFQSFAAGYTGRDFSMLERLLTQGRIVVWYMSLLLWPSPSRMSIEHDVMISSSLFSPPTTLPALALLIVSGWLLIRYRRHYPLSTYGGIWFFLNLVVESSIVPLELVFEHRLYLPSVGFCLLVVCMWMRACGHLLTSHTSRETLIVNSCCFALLCSGLTLLTFTRNEAWKDSITINQDAVSKAPANPRARANLAVAYGMSGLHELAIAEAEEALKLSENYKRRGQFVVAANTIVSSLVELQEYGKAVERGEQLLMNAPASFDASAMPNLCRNLGEAYLKSGDTERAYAATMKSLEWTQRQRRRDVIDLKRIEKLLTLILRESAKGQFDINRDHINDPGESAIKTWIAREFVKWGEREKAKSLLGSAVAENPADAEAVELLETLIREDALNYAQNTRESSRRTYQSSPFSRFNASMALAYLARTPGWSGYFRSVGEKLLDYALEIQPGVADAHLLKAYYVHDRKEIEPAIAATERALALDPDYSRAWLALGYFRMELNDFPGAVTAFKRGLELYPGCPQRASVLAAITAIEQNPALTTAQN